MRHRQIRAILRAFVDRVAIRFALHVLVFVLGVPGCDESDVTAEPKGSTRPEDSETAPEPLEVQETSTGEMQLLAPRWDDWDGHPPALEIAPVDGLAAEAYHFRGIVYERAEKDAKSTGIVRRGGRIAVKERVFGSGCTDGGWYAVEPYGYVCTKDGFWVSKTERDPEPDANPDLSQRIPYEYAKVVTQKAPRFFKVPDAAELAAGRAASSAESAPPEVVEKIMDGIFLLALRPKDKQAHGTFRRTVRGRFVSEQDLELRPNVPMRGELLEGPVSLPIAFVFDTDRDLLTQQGSQTKRVGLAEKHARLRVQARKQIGEKEYVEGPDGHLLERSAVRIAQVVSRPERIPAESKWIHVHLPEQTLVAYEGDEPVLATLVSSGQEGFETPTGVYQIQHKYVSVTMNGPDPDEGFYEVEEVPWTMYYFESFALHGAYWHSDFGKVRSHGCTNIPPTDARWLYYWSDPKVPAGWHAATRTPGTYVYITNQLVD